MSGFFSKDAIIEAVGAAHLPGAVFAHWALLAGVFITALYSFRLLFLVFHGRERMDQHTRDHVHESPAVITVPLLLLAVPSAIIGYLTIGNMLFGNYFADSITVHPAQDSLAPMAAEFHGAWGVIAHSVFTLPLWLALAGIATAWWLYLHRPALAENIKHRFAFIHAVLVRKYGFDEFNDAVFAGGGRRLGHLLGKIGDTLLIDGLIVNGTARSIGWFAGIARRLQSGFLYHYAFAMIIGLLVLLTWFVFLA